MHGALTGIYFRRSWLRDCVGYFVFSTVHLPGKQAKADLRVAEAGRLARNVVCEDDGAHRRLAGVALAHQKHLLPLSRLHR